MRESHQPTGLSPLPITANIPEGTTSSRPIYYYVSSSPLEDKKTRVAALQRAAEPFAED